ncbi:short chain aldehyde dehydrogenase 1-like [Hevea brasiliensis]|uniref:short chain aldehyde dehydrogenase 1-like n=1 Tax=Hevea brasiliensis TaxID=3981 RepID=UPI0025F65B37|nr:short chain aldehyde dehydrogenase 1-like [Hevea brasiliensis]
MAAKVALIMKREIEKINDFAVFKYGKLDIMFHDAGINLPSINSSGSPRILATDNEDFKKIIDLNMFGAFLGAKHADWVMIPAKKGASNHAVVGLTKNLRVELGRYGIRVNCISLFATTTPVVRKCLGMLAKRKAEMMASLPANLPFVWIQGL